MSLQMPPGRLYGETVRSQQVASFGLSERVYPPHFKTPKHSHRLALFCFVMEGSYTETFGGRSRECRSSSLLFHPPDEIHAENYHESGTRSFVVELDSDWLGRLGENLTIVRHSAEYYGGVLELLSRKLYKEFNQMDDVSPLVIEGIMLEMVGEASRRQSKSPANHAPRWLQQAKDLLHARFTEHLTLSDVAQMVGVHPVHLAQMFNKSFDCTVGDYVRRLRIEYACHELAASELPIVDIALAAGFCDQSHFTRTFKRCTGVAPSQYRESVLG